MFLWRELMKKKDSKSVELSEEYEDLSSREILEKVREKRTV